MSETEGTLRLADFLEAIPAEGWICCSCTFDAAVLPLEEALANLRAGHAALLEQYPQLRLQLVRADGLLHWRLAPAAECAFERLVAAVPRIDDAVPDTFPLDAAPLWRVRLCARAAAHRTVLRVHVSHALCSGRTLCDILELFLHVAAREPLPPALLAAQHQPLLPPFGKREWFTPELVQSVLSASIQSASAQPAPAYTLSVPASWSRLVPYKMNPDVALPSHVVCRHWRRPLAPVAAFCRRRGVTVQGVLIALVARAYRAYHRGALDARELAAYVPVDVRRAPGTTAAARRTALFFACSGVALVFVQRQRDLLRDVLHCQARLRAVLATDEAARCALVQAHILDERTRRAAFPPGFPNAAVHNIVFASHLGRVCPARADVLLGSSSPVAEDGYWPNLYAYHTDTELYFMFTPPYNVDPAFVAAFHDSAEEMMRFIEEDVGEESM